MMILGGRSHTIHPVAYWARLLGLVAVLLAVLISGCSGGGGGSSPSPGTGTTATVSGTLVVKDLNTTTPSTTPLSGIVISFTPSGGGATVTAATQSDGTFALTVPSDKAGSVTIPSSGYYSSVDYSANGVATTGSTSGIAIPALTVGTTYSLGTVKLSSTDGPPPPPGGGF